MNLNIQPQQPIQQQPPPQMMQNQGAPSQQVRFHLNGMEGRIY